MGHSSHHWIIDKFGNARCRHCSATKWFPPPKESMELTGLERTLVENYDPPVFWQTGSLHGYLEPAEGKFG